jgi:hypothetical protein
MRLRTAFHSQIFGDKMVLGEKLWEGNGKSMGPGFIKYVGMEGVVSMYTWMAQLKGFGCAKGMDCNVNVTGKAMQPPKGIGTAKDQGVLMTPTGDMAIVKGHDLSKMMKGKGSAVGLWSFMTMSEKLGWMNELIALVTIEALDPMWQEFKMVIYEWK